MIRLKLTSVASSWRWAAPNGAMSQHGKLTSLSRGGWYGCELLAGAGRPRLPSPAHSTSPAELLQSEERRHHSETTMFVAWTIATGSTALKSNMNAPAAQPAGFRSLVYSE